MNNCGEFVFEWKQNKDGEAIELLDTNIFTVYDDYSKHNVFSQIILRNL